MPTKSTTKSKSSSSKTGSKSKSTKLDLYTKHKNEYVASARTPSIVRVGPAKYLSVSGRSVPASAEFNAAVGALYAVAFTLKMARKEAGQDYKVTSLEGLWSLETPGGDPASAATIWNWELLIRVPTFVIAKEVQRTAESLVAKDKGDGVRKVRLVEMSEGECVQMLHIGPYTAEQPTLAKMREFAEIAGRKFTGRHHEIYLSDPRRVPPDRLKTILRQPVA